MSTIIHCHSQKSLRPMMMSPRRKQPTLSQRALDVLSFAMLISQVPRATLKQAMRSMSATSLPIATGLETAVLRTGRYLLSPTRQVTAMAHWKLKKYFTDGYPDIQLMDRPRQKGTNSHIERRNGSESSGTQLSSIKNQLFWRQKETAG